MAYSKTLLLVGLLFAAVLILSSEVSARDLAEAAAQTQGGVVEDKQWGHGQLDHHHHHHHHDHGHHGHHGHGKQGHGDEAMEKDSEGGKN